MGVKNKKTKKFSPYKEARKSSQKLFEDNPVKMTELVIETESKAVGNKKFSKKVSRSFMPNKRNS